MEYFPVGFAAGIGAGIATGTATGVGKARSAIRDYCESRGITLTDSAGNELPIDDVLNEALPASQCGKSKTCALLIAAGVLTLAVGVAVYLFYAR